MAATHIEHRFIPTKMQTVEEPVARAKFPIIAAAHHQERFDEENDAAIKHRITNADQRSEISWSSPFEREIPHRKQRGAAKQKSAEKARSVQSVIRFFLLHSIALERDSSRKFSTPDLSSMWLIVRQVGDYVVSQDLALDLPSLTCHRMQPNMSTHARHRFAHRPNHLALPHHREARWWWYGCCLQGRGQQSAPVRGPQISSRQFGTGFPSAGTISPGSTRR